MNATAGTELLVLSRSRQGDLAGAQRLFDQVYAEQQVGIQRLIQTLQADELKEAESARLEAELLFRRLDMFTWITIAATLLLVTFFVFYFGRALARPVEALGTSEARYHSLFEREFNAVMLIDGASGRFDDANQAALKLFGYSKNELLKLTVKEIFAAPEQMPEALTKLKTGEIHTAFERMFRRKDGSMFPGEIFPGSYTEADGRLKLTTVVQDISERKRVEQALRSSEQRHRLLFESSRDALMVVAPPSWKFTAANRATLELFGASSIAEYCALGPWDISPERQLDGRLSRERAQEAIVTALREGSLFFEWECQRLDGRAFTADVLLTRMEVEDEVFLQTTVRDITERNKSEQRLRLAAEALANIDEGILITDVNSAIVFANKAFTSVSGYELDEVIGRSPAFLQSGRHDADFYKNMWRQLLATGHWHGEVWDKRKNGEVYPIQLTLSTMRDKDGKVTHYVSVLNDISSSKRYEAQLERQAHYDALTNLPNRVLFRIRLEAALARARRVKSTMALFFLDLDRFKTINDTLGHGVGDTLLQQVGLRLSENIRESDTVARLGGDEFALLLDLLKSSSDAAAVAQKLLDALATVFLIEGNELFISASIGISCFPDDGAEIDTLFKHADTAMYQAKAQGRNAYRYFSLSDINARAMEALQLGNELRHAIERNELYLEYQPRVELRTGAIRGMEALARWRHPTRGMVPPATFIPIAEQSGQMEKLGDWVLQEACRQIRSWQEQGLEPQRVAVNLSALQFAHTDLPSRIAAILAEYVVDPSMLELEVTESVIMVDADSARKMLAELKSMGLLIAIDDFGTGYSSLSYLKRFPISYLKIDQSFVKGICSDIEDAAITRVIIALAKSLGLKLIAEGVETECQRNFLEREGCDEAQGFLFSHSLPSAEAGALLKKSSQNVENVPA